MIYQHSIWKSSAYICAVFNIP